MLPDNGKHRTSLFSSSPNPAPADKQFTFVLDWGLTDASPRRGPYDTSLLEKPHDHPTVAAAHARSRDPARPVTLEDCLEAFTQPERLTESDTWYCPRCKAHVQAAKKLDLWSCPELLVVHLKRFSYSRNRRDKLETLVHFPLSGLDLSKHMLQRDGPPPVYDLYAVSNHYGGLGGGHYTATALLPGTDKWYNFDDSHVSEVAPATLLNSAAYVLFYRRRSDAAADPPTLLPDLLLQLASEQQKDEDAGNGGGGATTRSAPASGRCSPVGAGLISATVHPDSDPPAGYHRPTPSTPTPGSPRSPTAAALADGAIIILPPPGGYTPLHDSLDDAMDADTFRTDDPDPPGPSPPRLSGLSDMGDEQGGGGEEAAGGSGRGAEEEAGGAPMVLGRTPPQLGPPGGVGGFEGGAEDGWDMVPRGGAAWGGRSGGGEEDEEEDDGAGSTAASAGHGSEFEMVGRQADSDDSMMSASH